MPALDRRLVALRAAAILVYLGLLALWTALVGIPSDPLSLFVSLWAATIACRAGAPLRSHVAFARDWSLPVLFLLAYSYSYGLIYLLGLPVHFEPAIAVDRWLGGGEILAQRLQYAICDGPCGPQGATWLDAILTTTYLSHFLTAWVLAWVLWMRHRAAWKQWMTRFVSLNLAGLVGYLLFPMAPPWMAARDGLISTPIWAAPTRGWSGIGLQLTRVLDGPLTNPVAAMPSLHAATAMLVALFAIHRSTRWWRWLALLYPALMCFTLLLYAEHYVLDEAVGIALALAVHAVVGRLERRPAAISARSAAADRSAPADLR
ncbi:MAG: phosphatase PAP2 family protein [Nocardioides sp.]